MGARDGFALVLGLCGIASGEPTPKEVDVKAFRDLLFVLQDAQGGTLIVEPVIKTYKDADQSDKQREIAGRVFYGPSEKAVYAQIELGSRTDEEKGGWSISIWAPKSDGLTPASVTRRADGSFVMYCAKADPSDIPLKRVPDDRAKPIIAKAKFFSSRIIHAGHLFARDDAGIYYYVDHIRNEYGGHGERLFVGKKGAMKELPLTDTVVDSSGEVYSTKTGDVRFVFDRNEPDKNRASFVKDEKKTELRILDTAVNARLIYRELGVYGPLGTLCEAY